MDALAQQRGGDFLWSNQGNDGGWHSPSYGALRPGAALTALCLSALAHLPGPLAEERQEAIRRAIDFLRPGLRRRGCIACPDGTLDYPVYATALTLLTPSPYAGGWTAEERHQMADYLLRSQLTEARGFEAANPDHGGWDVAGVPTTRNVTTGTNVSLVRYATTALAHYRTAAPAAKTADAVSEDFAQSMDSALRHARAWLHRCQEWPGHGGFRFSPHAESLDNKAGWEDGQRHRPRSYGTATCDGLLALQATGAARDEPRIVAAVGWLVERVSDRGVPGFPSNDQSGWRESLSFYYNAALAATLPFLPPPHHETVRSRIVRELVGRQAPNGSWSNPAPRMREDDPLIATSLAVVALATPT